MHSTTCVPYNVVVVECGRARADECSRRHMGVHGQQHRNTHRHVQEPQVCPCSQRSQSDDRTNLPTQVMAFPDFAFRDTLIDSFISHTDVLQYLSDYTAHFDLFKYIRVNAVLCYTHKHCTVLDKSGQDHVRLQRT
jgi:hypothetical protein